MCKTYLDREVFATARRVTLQREAGDVAGFDRYMVWYKAGLSAQRAAVENM